jgi:hypothetical protein
MFTGSTETLTFALNSLLLPAVDDDSQYANCQNSSYNLNANHNYPPFRGT